MQNYLKFLDVYIGAKCNLACFQCDTRSDIVKNKSQDPELETILAGIELAWENFDIEYYSMLGGEPLLYLERVEEVLKFIRAKDKVGKIIIPTNGAVLNKRFEEVGRLLTTYNASLFICNHYAGFENKKMSDELRITAKEFIAYMQLAKADNNIFMSEMLDQENKRQDPALDVFLKRKAKMLIDENDLVYTNGMFHVWFRDQNYFESTYYLKNGKPKPFLSDDPLASYFNSCCSVMCAFLYDKKLYKCAALGTLRRLLKHHDSLDDAEWQQFLNYKPLDLKNCTAEEVAYFSNTKYTAIAECSMCPSSSQGFTKTEDRVLPIKIYKREHSPL